MANPENLLICVACGTQFDIEDPTILKRCNICDDPRQYVPPTGQAFTTLSNLKSSSQKYKNKHEPFPCDQRFISIWTEPKFAIGQRAILVKTGFGNILWDCITFIDDETVEWIKSIGGLEAIVISHPHYYSTHIEWGEKFGCPVYISHEDKGWVNREGPFSARRIIEGEGEEIEIDVEGKMEKSGAVAVKLGGHFPGSLCLLAHGRLLIADTLLTTPAGLGDWSAGEYGSSDGRPGGMNSYAFMWSIPNHIPLSADEISGMWDVLKKHEFVSTHGAFTNTEMFDGSGGSRKRVKERILESMQIQVRRMGWKVHGILRESVKPL